MPTDTPRPGAYLRLQPEDVTAFARDILLSPDRKKPVVAITSVVNTGGTWIEPGDLARDLGEHAVVVLLETGETTWTLTEIMPPRLEVFGGAVRIWWPGVSPDSDPHDHPLKVIHSDAQARAVHRWIVESILPPEALDAGAGGPEGEALRILRAKVVEVARDKILLEVEGREGFLVDADLPLEVLAEQLTKGQQIPVRVLPGRIGTKEKFTCVGLLPTPWERVAEEYGIGDVVRGRVQAVKDYGAFVTILPGANGLVHKSEIDWAFVKDPGRFLQPGQRVQVKILSLDAKNKRSEFSIKSAYGSEPKKAISLVPGGAAFLEGDPQDDGRPGPSMLLKVKDLREELEELRDELESVIADRASIMSQLKLVKDQLAEALEALKRAEQRPRSKK
jgi:hypothetical protein